MAADKNPMAHKHRIPPSAVTDLHATAVTPTSIALSWNAPAIGTLPIHYTVFIREHTATRWRLGAKAPVTTARVARLRPDTEYQIEVMASNV